jgi:hypothetical protein
VASRLAAVIDRLASLGITTRTGDAVALTPLGSALLRDALILGTALIADAAGAAGGLRDGDIVVVTSKIVSKAEGRVVRAPRKGRRRRLR